MRSRAITISLLLYLIGTLPMLSEDALDAPKHIFQDELLDKMAGFWNLSGQIMRHDVTHRINADWVLNHQFLRIHEKDTAAAQPGAVPYEALVMVGHDNASERYVAHWTDVCGGGFSETLGYRKRTGDDVEFVFEYPDGPFHTTFSWKPDSQQWRWLMRGEDKEGHWFDFGDMNLGRIKED